MARRKLKKSVRNTIRNSFLGLGILFTGGFIANGFNEDHVIAESSEKVQVEKEMSYLEMSEKNDELASEYSGHGVEAFYLYGTDDYSVFMRNDTKEKIFVKNTVLEQSFASMLSVGDNVKLYTEKLDVTFVDVEAGKSIDMAMLELYDYNSDYTKIVYQDEVGNTYSFDKEFIEANKLDNGANVGSVATGYVYDGEIVAVTNGW